MTILDMSHVIVAKSDQLNADDLISGPLTVQVTGVKISDTGEQQVAVSYAGDNGKPWKPCKSMCRILVHCWGRDAKEYAGRWLTLYRDDEVMWGGMKVGGIRVSHMSHINGQQTVVIAEKKGKKKPIIIKPLAVPQTATQELPAVDVAATKEEGIKAAKTNMGSLRVWWAGIGPRTQNAIGGATFLAELKAIAEKSETPEPTPQPEPIETTDEDFNL